MAYREVTINYKQIYGDLPMPVPASALIGLDRADVDEDGFHSQGDVEFPLNSDGGFAAPVSLWCNAEGTTGSHYVLTNPYDGSRKQFVLPVGDGSPVSLMHLIIESAVISANPLNTRLAEYIDDRVKDLIRNESGDRYAYSDALNRLTIPASSGGINSYLKAALPAAPTTSLIARVTDAQRGLHRYSPESKRWWSLSGEVNVADFGATGSVQTTTGSITSGTNQLTLASVIDLQIGNYISVANARAGGLPLIARIDGLNGQTATLSANATATVAGGLVLHDATNAFRAAVAAAVALVCCQIKIPRGTFYLNGDFEGVNRKGRVALPDIPVGETEEWHAIRFVGEVPIPQYFGTLGNPPIPKNASILKSTRRDNLGEGAVVASDGGLPYGSLLSVYFSNIVIETTDNPDQHGIDAYFAQQFELTDSLVYPGVYGGAATDPTHTAIYGVITPQINNGAYNVLLRSSVMSYYTGFQINEHTFFNYTTATACEYAYEFKAAYHSSLGLKANAYRCRRIIKTDDGAHYCDILNLNLELKNPADTAGGFLTDFAVYDPSNYFHGTVNVHSVMGMVGVVSSLPAKNGGANADVLLYGRKQSDEIRDIVEEMLTGNNAGNTGIAFARVGDYINASVSGGSYDADASAYLSTIGILNSPAVYHAGTPQEITGADIWTAVDAFYAGLKADGIYAKLSAFYLFIGGTEAAHKFNGKDARDLDAAFRLSFAGAWTHGGAGATPNGTNAYANTFLVPSAQLAQNSAHLSVYTRTNQGAAANMPIGCNQAAGEIFHINASTNGNTVINSTSAVDFPAAAGLADTIHHWLGTRTGANTTKLFIDGVLNDSGTGASSALPTTNVYLGAVNGSGTPLFYSSQQIAFASIGAGLNDAESANLFARVEALQSALLRSA